MSAYSLDDERTIRAGRRAHDWMKSGLLSAEQYERIKPELQVDLRRTNLFLRITLFIFSLMILQSALGLVAVFVLALFLSGMGGEARTAVLCVFGAALTFWLAGFLVDKYRLYRFGIEEAAAVAAVGLMAGAAALAWSVMVPRDQTGTIVAGLVAGGAMALAMFLKFGYVYAALAAMVCAAGLPFVFGDAEFIQRLISIGILAAIAAGAWLKRAEYDDDYPGDTYGLIEAAAWSGIYAVINLQVFADIDRAAWFYWPTYAGMWIVPLLGLWLSIRNRHRILLDVSVLMLLITLMLNKQYLGSPRYPWDPIVFGLLLMGTAIGIKRWLAGGEDGGRDGFTATRILASDKSKVGAFGMASLAHPAVGPAHPGSAPADPIGGGGRSGGAGAGGSF